MVELRFLIVELRYLGVDWDCLKISYDFKGNLNIDFHQGPNLLGRNWFPIIGISIHGIHFQSVSIPVNELLDELSDIFQGLGCFNGKPLDLPLDSNVQPLLCKPRRVPLALKPRIDEAIDQLISQGIILPVDSADRGTPIVPVLKSEGSVRICADHKVTLNKAVNIFARLDLTQAYHQNKNNVLRSFSKKTQMYVIFASIFAISAFN